jgi:glucosylceramidase
MIQRGARVFASSGEFPGIDHVAAENPDGSKVLVLTNQNGGEQRMQVLLEEKSMQVTLPPDSVTTVVW